jgi:glycosyltransferase involved in cell wall biosynthesis
LYSSQISILNHKNLTPLDGGTIRVKNIVSGLADRGHDVTFAYWGSQENAYGRATSVAVEKPKMNTLLRLGRSLYRGEEGGAAIDLLLCNLPSMFMKMRGNMKSAAIVQSEQIWSAMLPMLYRRLLNKVCVLDDHNVEALLALRLAPFVSNPETYAYWVRYVSTLERLCCSLADTIVVTSETDREGLAKFHGITPNKIHIIPNGTDLSKYKPDDRAGLVTREKLGVGSAPLLVFVGRAGYPPNGLAIDFINRRLSDMVWKKHPDARFLIVSRDLPKGYLPDDGRIMQIREENDAPYIQAADVCLAPLSVGGGTRIKIATYLACGKASVSTPLGCEGIPVSSGKELLVSSLENFGDSVNYLLDHQKERENLGANAREFALKNCSWKSSVGMFDNLFDALLSKNGS